MNEGLEEKSVGNIGREASTYDTLSTNNVVTSFDMPVNKSDLKLRKNVGKLSVQI